jgi:hypothetical protein
MNEGKLQTELAGDKVNRGQTQQHQRVSRHLRSPPAARCRQTNQERLRLFSSGHDRHSISSLWFQPALSQEPK